MSKQTLTMVSLAAALATADSNIERAENAASAVIEDIARFLGTSPTLESWNAAADEFQSAYMAARGCSEKTAANRWSAVVRALNANHGLEKPRAKTAAAQTKAQQRESAADKRTQLLASMPATATAQDFLAKAAESLAANDPTAAKVFQDAALAKGKEAAKVAKDAAREALKAEKEKARRLLTECDDAAMLHAVCDLLASPAKLAAVVRVLAKDAPVKATKATKAGKPAAQAHAPGKSGSKASAAAAPQGGEAALADAGAGTMGAMAQALALVNAGLAY